MPSAEILEQHIGRPLQSRDILVSSMRPNYFFEVISRTENQDFNKQNSLLLLKRLCPNTPGLLLVRLSSDRWSEVIKKEDRLDLKIK